MTERQSQLLKELLERYIATAEPIASAQLARTAGVSPATVRNDFAELEGGGYLLQPHTSAGRIPTLKGYQYYLKHFYQPKEPAGPQKSRLKKAGSSASVRELAKELAEMTNLAILVAFAESDFYYTGISKLFSQPEFAERDQIVHISSVIETFDKIQAQLYDNIGKDIRVLIGKENPLSEHCALVTFRASHTSFSPMISLLGPLRMDYNANAGLLAYTRDLLEHE